MILNETPLKTSKNFGINNINIENIEIPQNISRFNNTKISGDISNIKITDNIENIDLTYGLGKDFLEQSKNNFNQNIKIESNSEKETKIYIDFDFDKENKELVDNIEIIASQNSNLNIVIKYNSKLDEYFYHNGIIKTILKDNAKVKILVVNFLNKKSVNFLNFENELENKTDLEFDIVDFGGKYSISNYYSNLIGENSKNYLNTIYLGKESQIFDLNYIIELRGKKSVGNINVQGALDNNAKKNFKGTIDFKKGAKKAIGQEEEFCILLSKEARSKALPMLLCTEEDVEGAHSSAAGKVDENLLFYIMSRGFTYKEALNLIIRARFNQVIDKIDNEHLRKEILEKI